MEKRYGINSMGKTICRFDVRASLMRQILYKGSNLRQDQYTSYNNLSGNLPTQQGGHVAQFRSKSRLRIFVTHELFNCDPGSAR
jgi:hypothetical protein